MTLTSLPKTLLYRVTTITLLTGYLVTSCPVTDQTVLRVCECQTTLSGLTLDCSGSNFNATMTILKLAAAELGLIQELSFRNSSIGYLPARTFEGLFVKKLDLSSNEIEEIDSQAFKGLENILQILYLKQNKLREVPSDALNGIVALLQLDLSNNTIGNLASETLLNVPKLFDLNLADNRICKAYKDAFKNIKFSLQTLNLGGNCLTKVPAPALRGFQQLLVLHLHNNKIPQLEPLQFMNMPALYLVNLAGNEIRAIHKQSFLNVPNLKFLYLGDNKIEELEPYQFQPFDSLELVDLSRNKIGKIPTQAFANLPRLAQLYLTGNAIEEIEGNAFANSSLVILLLNENKLKQVTGEMLFGLNGLQQFSLRNNENAFYQLPSLVVLDMSYNNISALYPATFLAQLGMFMLDLSSNNLASVPYNAFNQRIVTVVLQENPLVCTERVHVLQNSIGIFVPGTADKICGGPGESVNADQATPTVSVEKNPPPPFIPTKIAADQPTAFNPVNVINGLSQIPPGSFVPGLSEANAGPTSVTTVDHNIDQPPFTQGSFAGLPPNILTAQQPAAGRVVDGQFPTTAVNHNMTETQLKQFDNNTVIINQPGRIIPENINGVPLYSFSIPTRATPAIPTGSASSNFDSTVNAAGQNVNEIPQDFSSKQNHSFAIGQNGNQDSLQFFGNKLAPNGLGAFQVQTGFPHFQRNASAVNNQFAETNPGKRLGSPTSGSSGSRVPIVVYTGVATTSLPTLPAGIIVATDKDHASTKQWQTGIHSKDQGSLNGTKESLTTPSSPELRSLPPKKVAETDQLGTIPNPLPGEATASLSASTTIAVCLTVVIVVMLVVFITLCVVRHRQYTKASESSASRTSAYVAAQAARANYAASVYATGTYLRETPPRPPTRNGMKTPTNMQQAPNGWIYAPAGTYATASSYYK